MDSELKSFIFDALTGYFIVGGSIASYEEWLVLVADCEESARKNLEFKNEKTLQSKSS